MKRAIITGATGAIGSALIEELVNNNIEVLVFTRKDSHRNSNLMKNKLVKVRYCSLAELSSVENESSDEYDVFFHFAWAGASGPGRNDMYLQNTNVKYALDAVGAAKRFGCKKFVGAGSQAEYGRHEGMLLPETSTFPEMGYGYAKLCAGQMTRDYAHQIGMEHVWTRILSVYGPNDGKQSMVMSTIDTLLDGEVPQFTKGEQKWDYLYSGDAAKAFRLIGEAGVDGKVYVLGSGSARPLKSYIREIRDIVAPNATLDFGAIPYSSKQVMFLQADISELKKDTGFVPCMTFSDGVKKILEKNYRG